MFNGNYMNKIRTSNIDQTSKPNKFNTHTFNQYETNEQSRENSVNQPHTSQNMRTNMSSTDNKAAVNSSTAQHRHTPNTHMMATTNQFFNSSSNNSVN